MKLIARDKNGILVHFTEEELRKVGIFTTNADAYYSTSRRASSDKEVVNILTAVLEQHQRATKMILDYSDLPRILDETLGKLKQYAQARADIVMAGMESKGEGQAA